MTPEFFRQPTEEEKKDFKPLMNAPRHPMSIFKNKVEVVEKEFGLKRLPYCARCAKFDFKDKIDEQVNEMERRSGYANFSELNIPKLDLYEYGKSDRFKLIGETKAMEPTASIREGSVTRQVQIGIHRDFRCKIRNCGISVFISNDDLKENKAVPDMQHPVKTKAKAKR